MNLATLFPALAHCSSVASLCATDKQTDKQTDRCSRTKRMTERHLLYHCLSFHVLPGVVPIKEAEVTEARWEVTITMEDNHEDEDRWVEWCQGEQLSFPSLS